MADTKIKYMFADTCEPIFYTTDIKEEGDVWWGFISDQTRMILMSDADMDHLIEQKKVVEETESSLGEILGNIMDMGNDKDNMFISLGALTEIKDEKEKAKEAEEPTSTIVVPKTYRPELCNTSIDPQDLVKKLQIAESKTDRPDCISMLFEGVPGTGKTLAAAYIAKELGKTLASYRLSDIMNKYVGESERKISEAFDKAAKDGAILHIDEVDSISNSRDDDSKGHEVKLVSALLQNLDQFKGICIFTTNYLDRMDPAIKRRMLLKQSFKNCTSDQANQLSELFFGKRKAPKNLPDGVLAPADFNLVKGSFLFEEDSKINRKFILERLLAEAKERNGKDLVNRKQIGFVS